MNAAWSQRDVQDRLVQWLLRRTPGEWARIDESYRRSWAYREPGVPDWACGALADGIRSLSSDGRERERAVRSLGGDGSEVSIGFILLRCDDWVTQVRLSALAAFHHRAAAGGVDFRRWIPLIVARDRRIRGGGLLTASAAIASAEDMRALLSSADRPTRRWAVSAVLSGNPDVPALEALLAGAADPAIAHALAVRLSVRVDDHGLELLLANRRACVRAPAWELVVGGRLPGLNLRSGLLDRVRSIRLRAQRAARLRGVDAGALYLGMEPAGHVPQRRQLLGLMEWGAPEAVAMAQQMLDHPNESLRVAAIEALSRSMAHPESVLVPLLARRHGAELRATVRGLLRRPVRIAPLDLQVLREGTEEQRIAAWRLGRARGRWERLLADLHALGHGGERLTALAEADLGSWIFQVMPRAGHPPASLHPLLVHALREAQRSGRDFRLVSWVLGV